MENQVPKWITVWRWAIWILGGLVVGFGFLVILGDAFTLGVLFSAVGLLWAFILQWELGKRRKHYWTNRWLGLDIFLWSFTALFVWLTCVMWLEADGSGTSLDTQLVLLGVSLLLGLISFGKKEISLEEDHLVIRPWLVTRRLVYKDLTIYYGHQRVTHSRYGSHIAYPVYFLGRKWGDADGDDRKLVSITFSKPGIKRFDRFYQEALFPLIGQPPALDKWAEDQGLRILSETHLGQTDHLSLQAVKQGRKTRVTTPYGAQTILPFLWIIWAVGIYLLPSEMLGLIIVGGLLFILLFPLLGYLMCRVVFSVEEPGYLQIRTSKGKHSLYLEDLSLSVGPRQQGVLGSYRLVQFSGTFLEDRDGCSSTGQWEFKMDTSSEKNFNAFVEVYLLPHLNPSPQQEDK